MVTPPAIRIIDVDAEADLPGHVPPPWRRRPVASPDRATTRYVLYDPRFVAVVRCGPHQDSPLTGQLHTKGYRPLHAEPAVWWRPRAVQHAAAA